ncbi:MAG: hypothetical protein WCA29_12380 [Jiangellales bacterium]|jgi:hypothetical protein
MDHDELRVLGCVVCGDDGDFFTLHHDPAEDELICARCGQARLVPMLGATHRVA